MKVSISILKEYDNYEKAIEKVNSSCADFLHVDVMDGVFVKNRCVSLEELKNIKRISTKPLDVHLMVKDHEKIKSYASILPDFLTLHVEVIEDNSLIKYLKSLGIKVGIAINPETSINELLPYVNDVDLILFMSVNPGSGGQTFKKEVLKKVKEVRSIVKPSVVISIDGGVNDEVINLCKQAGCDMVVSGAFITNSSDYNERINKLTKG